MPSLSGLPTVGTHRFDKICAPQPPRCEQDSFPKRCREAKDRLCEELRTLLSQDHLLWVLLPLAHSWLDLLRQGPRQLRVLPEALLMLLPSEHPVLLCAVHVHRMMRCALGLPGCLWIWG